MLRHRFLLLLLLASSGWSATSVISYRNYASSYPLLVAVPASYSSPSLVIQLHGAGEVGNGSYNGTLVYAAGTNEVALTLVHGALECVNNGVTWFASNNVIVAAPQTPTTWNTTTLDNTVAALIAEFGVNTSRICVTGLSLGGGGAWAYGVAHPSRCYSLVPIAGSLQPAATPITVLGSVKVMAVHNAADPTVPIVWDVGTAFASQPWFTAWLYQITGVEATANHPDSPTWSTHSGGPHLNGVTTTNTANWTGSAWVWTAGATLPTSSPAIQVYPTAAHGGWDETYGTGPSDFGLAFWQWALGVSPSPPAQNFPDPLRSGSALIQASMGLAATGYASVGTPAALTSVCTPTHEFTVLVRTCRALAASTGIIIGQGDNTNTTWSISSLGGSRASCNVGGVGIVTNAGSIQNPTWNDIALVCRNDAGTFRVRCVLDSSAGQAETAVGAQVCTKDILIGARRNTSNTDSASLYSGNIGDICIWDYALTDDQVHYAMGYITPNENINGLYGSGLIAYWPCNEQSGLVVHEDIAGNDGTCSASGLFTTSAYPKYPICTVGDSLTAGSGSQTNTPYGQQVLGGGSGLRNMRSSYTYGFPGMNVAYIQTQIRLSSYAPFLNWTQVYLVGIHDLGANSNVTSFLSTAISALPHSRYLIIGNRPFGATGVVNGVGNPNGVGIGDWGQTQRLQIDSQNYLIQSIYGSRWLSEQYLSVSQASLPTEANDVFQLRTPVSICADNTHLLNAGYILQSQGADIALTSFGW